MLKRWPKKIVILGAVVTLLGTGSAILKINTELHYGNMASDSCWVRPTSTPFDAFVLSFPVREVFLTGIALLIAGVVAMHFQCRAEESRRQAKSN
jgi:hypothetical protein